MTGMDIINEELIPVQKIISVACRNFMAFKGLNIFEFTDGVNSIIGGNASGKTSLLTIISQALRKNIDQSFNNRWYRNFNHDESLIEIKFMAGDKEHYLRRVMLGDTTTDLHLYVQNKEKQDFYRDGGAIEYLARLKPLSGINQFEGSRKDFYVWTNGKNAKINPLFSKYEGILDKINHYLPLTHTRLYRVRLIDGKLMVQYREGELKHAATLAEGEIKVIFAIAKILNFISLVEKYNTSRVILIDELDIGLDKSKINGIYDAFDAIAEHHNCQFMIASRYRNGRSNQIRLSKPRVPQCYKQTRPSNMHNLIKSYVKNYNSNSTFKSVIRQSKNQANSGYKITYQKGIFKWNP